MKALLRRGGWLTGMLILSMPMFLIFFLGSQMAYGEVQRRYETYAIIPEYTSVTQMQALTAGATVLLRGRIAKPGVLDLATDVKVAWSSSADFAFIGEETYWTDFLILSGGAENATVL